MVLVALIVLDDVFLVVLGDCDDGTGGTWWETGEKAATLFEVDCNEAITTQLTMNFMFQLARL